MNTIETYTGNPRNIPPGCEITKDQLAFQVALLMDVVQSLIERIGEKEGVQLGVISQVYPDGLRYKLYQKDLEK